MTRIQKVVLGFLTIVTVIVALLTTFDTDPVANENSARSSIAVGTASSPSGTTSPSGTNPGAPDQGATGSAHLQEGNGKARTVQELQEILTTLRAEQKRLEEEVESGKNGKPAGQKPVAIQPASVLAEKDRILKQAELNDEIKRVRKRYADFASESSLDTEMKSQLEQLLGEYELELKLLGRAESGLSSSYPEYKKYPKLSYKEREEIEKVVKKNLETSLRGLLGPQRYQEYDQFNQTYFQRRRLEDIEERLGKAGLTLEGSQRGKMIEVLKQNTNALETKFTTIPKGPKRWEQWKLEYNAMDETTRKQMKSLMNPQQQEVIDGMGFKPWYTN